MKNFDSVITDREGTASVNRSENNILNPTQSNNPQKQANHCKIKNTKRGGEKKEGFNNSSLEHPLQGDSTPAAPTQP